MVVKGAHIDACDIVTHSLWGCILGTKAMSTLGWYLTIIKQQDVHCVYHAWHCMEEWCTTVKPV